MDDRNVDKLLEDSFSGGPPGPAFRAKTLLDSTGALVARRRMARRWRTAALSAAAVLIAAISFLLGRCSVEQASPRPAASVAAGDAANATVSNELIEWLEAAQLFRQLKMEDRMARAVDRAAGLLPVGLAAPDGRGPVLESPDQVVSERNGPPDRFDNRVLQGPFWNVNRIMAQSFAE
ncbi:MAG: hypothetical protein ACM3VT_00265 [Solirubrobacterales bacterium]